MRRLWLGAAVVVVACAASVAVWLGRREGHARDRSVGACTLRRDAVYAFIGVGAEFETAVVDVAHPAELCADRRLPRDAREVGVRGSDGALLYLRDGRLFRATPEAATWSEMKKAWAFPRDPPPDPEIATPKCRQDVEGFLTSPDSDRLVYWCRGGGGFHDSTGADLAIERRTSEQPIALGPGRTALVRRDRATSPLVVIGPVGARIEVKGVDLRFGRARLPVRATADGFLVLVPKGLDRSHELYRVDRAGKATADDRFEDLPDLEIGSLDVVLDEDGGLHAQTRLGADGAEAVVHLPPHGRPLEVVYRPSGDQRFAASNLLTAP